MDKFIAFIGVFVLSAFITFQSLMWYQIKKMPFFSVIIPVYNYGQYVGETIESVLASDYPNFEIIIVNDGSTDNSLSVIQKYAQKDKRIKVIDQENQGLSLSRNNAMKIAKGDYFWFVDADDYIASFGLSELAKQIKHTQNPDLISFEIQPMSEDGMFLPATRYNRLPKKLQRYRHRVFYGRSLSTVEISAYPVTSGKQIYAKKFLQKHNIQFIPHLVFEDDVFFLSVIEADARGTAIFKPLYFKRKHDNSIISNRGKYYSSIVMLPRLIYEEVKRVQSLETRARDYFDAYFGNIFSNLSVNEQDVASLKGLLSWMKEQPEDAFFNEKIKRLESFIEEMEQH